MLRKGKSSNSPVWGVLKKHFDSTALHDLVSASRVFPATARVDLQTALDHLFSTTHPSPTLLGLHQSFSPETLTFSHLTLEGDHPVVVGPLQYDEVETGEAQPARCLKNGMWLCRQGGTPFAVLLTLDQMYGQISGFNLEVVVPPGKKGLDFTRKLLEDVAQEVARAGSYRGKVLSLETASNYWGKSGGIKVHRLRPVRREEIILPEKTLKLLERNITQFVTQREALRRLDMPVKKGLLFYGPPGTGKTYTIHYLASQMKDHTTLLITAEQVGLLDEYMQLARFLQPVMVVIEDADLIARPRTHMRSPCEESLLNRLLNEMDGLREDAMILFILTTNNPEQLETALTSRPGRIDQAIEFPLPDDDGRRKLVHLYSRHLEVPSDLVEVVVRKTKRSSAAFIKELMRRSAQYQIQHQDTGPLREAHLEAALDEMLFSGGSLNVKLLGGAGDGGAD
jgi:AAA+ superfamily predicted ATPase